MFLLVSVYCDTAQAMVFTKHTHEIYLSILGILSAHTTQWCDLWSHTHILQIAIIHSHTVCADSGSSPTMHNVKLQCIHILKHAWSFLPCCPLCIWFYRTWTHTTIIPVRACILRICNCRHILISTHYTMHLRWSKKSFHPWPLSRLWLALEHPAGNTVYGCTCGMLSSGASAASPRCYEQWWLSAWWHWPERCRTPCNTTWSCAAAWPPVVPAWSAPLHSYYWRLPAPYPSEPVWPSGKALGW